MSRAADRWFVCIPQNSSCTKTGLGAKGALSFPRCVRVLPTRAQDRETGSDIGRVYAASHLIEREGGAVLRLPAIHNKAF